jgi:branched-chain amino acid transport system ATP-binding protein
VVDEQHRTADAGGDAGHEAVLLRDPVLEVAGVSVRFGGVAALNDVSLEVHSGEVTGLIGPNGAGKTTLFNVVSGLQRPDRGSVRIAGIDVTNLGPHRRARQGLARTFQRLELFGTLSAVDNVRVGLEARRARGSHQEERGALHASAAAIALLERVGVSGVATEPVNALSTGTARLVELARALAIDPRVLLLDEPSSGLDDRETAGLGTLLRALATERRAVLLVEHDMDLVLEICDVVHVLDFGEVIASGAPSEVRADPAVQAAYLGKVGAAPSGRRSVPPAGWRGVDR